MVSSAAKYEIKADKREFAAMVVGYATVFVAAAVFIFIIFRAAHLIRQYQPGVDTLSYTEMHVYVVLIEVVLWTIIARAAIRLKAYTWRIKHSKDGAALDFIANAILLSFGYVLLFDIASTFKTLFMGNASLPVVTTMANLLPLAVFLLLSALLFVGSVRLAHLAPGGSLFKQRHQRLMTFSLALFALLVVPYGDYFYHVASGLHDDDGLRRFVLPPAVLLIVYLAPCVIVWLLGLLSCLNLAKYAQQVPGKIYRPKFRNLCVGILISYISTYLIQLFAISNMPSNRFGFGTLLVALLFVVVIIGYSLIYHGANQLYMLEQEPTG